jgi:hypothetical protein
MTATFSASLKPLNMPQLYVATCNEYTYKVRLVSLKKLLGQS